MTRPDLSETFPSSRRRKDIPGHHPAIAFVAVALLILCFIAPVDAGGLQGERSPWSPTEDGIKVYQEGRCCDGYTVFGSSLAPPRTIRLIDMNAVMVREWTPVGGCGYLAKLLTGGSVLSFGGDGSQTGHEIAVQQYDWNGELTWNYSDWTEVGGERSAEAHHDFQREGNPVGYYAPGMEPVVTGGKTLVLSDGPAVDPEISVWSLTDPVIYEIDWDGEHTGYEWHGIDHFEEYGFDDSAKSIIKTFPYFGDYLHMNSMSTLGPNRWYDGGDARFHPDNIIASCRSANLFFIIDRQTGHIVYKIGPDYSDDTPEGQKLGQIVGQHHTHIIPRGLPGEGNILVFDNGGLGGYPQVQRGYSRVIEFDPITLDIVWEYKHLEGNNIIPTGNDHPFYSFFISGAQRLPNGNTLITEGAIGRFLEVTSDNEIVWEYYQGGPSIYRAYRVPPEWVPGNPAGYPEWGSLIGDSTGNNGMGR